ncbi:MAG TPA: hypothetical protein VFA65_22620 [Bryobacteraceae bacterium]|nr:hypothetical protein [Bryobacteraceae bacterium]
MSSWFLCNPRSVFFGPFTVGIGILHSDCDGMPDSQRGVDLVRAQFSDDYRSISGIQLHAMIANA